MEPIYNFGISQVDALTEYRSLEIQKGDRDLCVASAGEVPLNLLAMEDVNIDAVDISLAQLHLSRLKFHAVRSLEPLEAASLIGWFTAPPEKRLKLFSKVSELMDEQEKQFWEQNIDAIRMGPVHVARYEKYIHRFSWIGLLVIGKKQLLQLFELDTIAEQQEFFDRHLSTNLLKKIFKLAFHPKIYKNRGIPVEALQHRGERNIADFFYSRFRDFCSATSARKNHYLQFAFFNHLLFPEALPAYLTEEGVVRIRNNHRELTFSNVSYNQALEKTPKGVYNKLALSNVCDWMDKNEFSELLNLIITKAQSPSRILSRYIHHNYPIEADHSKYLKVNNEQNKRLEHMDRYPFYSLVPIKFSSTGFNPE